MRSPMKAALAAILVVGLLGTAAEAFSWRSLISHSQHRHLLQAYDPAATGAAVAAAPAPAPKVLRPGVYVIEDPPPAPKVAAPAVANTTANVTRGPKLPAAGKNLMVVMTVMGQEAKDIYGNQEQLKKDLANVASVAPNQVYFYNQTANQDVKTGVTALSLVMNLDCSDQMECAQAGAKLVNSTSQTKLTDALAKSSISLLPGTFQVYGVNAVGKYKGNTTLYENKALTAPKPAITVPDYNSTMARYNLPIIPTAAQTNRSAAGKALPGALPGSVPTTGPLGNFTIPDFEVTYENSTLTESPMSLAPMGSGDNSTLFPGLTSDPTAAQPTAATADAAPAQAPEPAPKQSGAAAAAVFAVMPAFVTAAAVLLL